ncbi:10 kDa chaperonin 1, chloroplastic, partial [Cucurbita argyrosperma subsp. argyrosperma]
MAMASTFVTVPKPFNDWANSSSVSSRQQITGTLRTRGFRRSSLKVSAVSKKWEPTKVVPQADRVLLRLEELPEKSAGGVLLPKSAVKFERHLVGEILSIGSEVGGSDLAPGKKVIKVILSDINAYEVDLGTDAKHCFCKASDLLAVVE